MKHKWLAFALVALAALGIFGVALTGQLGGSWVEWTMGVVTAATLAFVRRPWWAWAVIGVGAATGLLALFLADGAGWYLLPSAFLAVVAGLLDLAAPKKGAAG